MLKFKKCAPAGGVSKIVTVRFAFPPPHVVQGALFDIPLHDEIKKTAATNDIKRKIRFIEHPMKIRKIRSWIARRRPPLVGNLQSFATRKL